MTRFAVRKNLLKALTVGAFTSVVAGTMSIGQAQAAVVTLDFEGVGNLSPVGNFYNTDPHDFDITFSPNALGLVDQDAGGSGNIGGEPSPSTVLFFLDGPAATLNALKGFSTGFSFFYSAINNPGFIKVYDGLNATGNILATLNLPTTPFNGAPDPTGQFSPLLPIGVSFSGIAKSVDFGGTVNQIVFDNITFGSATPGSTVPEPITILGTLTAAGFGVALRRKQKLQQKATVKA
ncbi:hypothetical protein BV372_32585 [Nostoc sp. T09]|uniref:PEP-CTERM sorting domain-containing protein n=1 Tax=Nostoc sp. T09 TaxID=1932621 RepID=UPI000B680BAE|nr:PEP-CTERM sorting domain-containing protein [Nostoc sp. T09]OUL20770.1 hypothetical protein BV372_32585 [Nostoc sp. T09]